MKHLKNYKLLLIKMPLLLVLFSLFCIVIDSAIINSYAPRGGGRMTIPREMRIPEPLKGHSSETFKSEPLKGHSSETFSVRPQELIPVKFSKPDLKVEIGKKLEKFKLNKLNSYPKETTNSLYDSNKKNFLSIVNYVRAFANFIIVIPQMLNYR